MFNKRNQNNNKTHLKKLMSKRKRKLKLRIISLQIKKR